MFLFNFKPGKERVLDNCSGKYPGIKKSCPYASEFEWKISGPILKKFNIEVDKKNKNLIYNNKTLSYFNHFNIDSKYTQYSRNKNLSNIIYDKYNIPYPKYSLLSKLDINNNYLNYPLIIKPINGTRGKDMIEDIKSNKELIYQMNKLDLSNYIIQEQKKGITYRILVLNNKIICIKESLPPFIIGNGNDDVETLIKKLNKSLKKNDKISYVKRVSYNYIKSQGFNKSSIVPSGKKVYITNVINRGNGAQESRFIPLTKLHPVNIELCLKVCESFKLNFCGIDYITKDLSQPYYLSDGNILEVNTKPAFSQILLKYPKQFFNALFNN